MHILFVDDEIDVLDGMMDGVDFDAIGIENVHISTNATHAKSILEQQQIDIMVTDIEMPGESGLDLLKWVRDSERDIITIFCTGYANFNYAQKAVEMRSFGYFLKPISYASLQEHLRLAVEEAKKNRSLASYKNHRQYWLALQKENQKLFWERIISGNVRGEKETFKNCEENQLFYTRKDLFTLCIFSLLDNEDTLSSWKKYAFKNISEEIFGNTDMNAEAILQIRDDAWCLFFKQDSRFNEQQFRTTCQRIISTISKHLSAVINCYYVTDSPLVNCYTAFFHLNDIFQEDLLSQNKLYSAADYPKTELTYQPPNLQEWELLFSAGRIDELLSKIHAHLARLAARKEINVACARSLQFDLLQMLQSTLQQQQISTVRVFSDARYEFLREHSIRSISKLQRHLEYIVRSTSELANAVSQSQSAVGKVKAYIDNHLDEEITRSNMARMVYLNSDYFAKLFKKETNQSLGAYLLDKRIHEAKRLLVRSNIPVNAIAQKVGYDNFSYFSHVFREKTGMTPNEYRKDALRKEKA